MITELDFDTDIEEKDYLLLVYNKVDIKSFSVKKNVEIINEKYPDVKIFLCEAEDADTLILNLHIEILPSVFIFKNGESVSNFHGLIPLDVMEAKTRLYLL